MKKAFVTWLLFVVLQFAAVGTVLYFVHGWWVDNQISQRIEVFADKNFPASK
jgi:hypothetical protein